jgi:hypothetical protein
VGTLHHTKDPIKAWQNLRSRLLPGGFMKIGLYSHLGRQAVEWVKKIHLPKNAVASTINQLRNWRQRLLLSTRDNHLNALLRLNDFYYAAGFKDLLFHERERTFSLLEIEQILAQLNLTFLGLDVDDRIRFLFHQMFPNSDGKNLAEWITFEQRYQDAFIGMYQFWCRSQRRNPLITKK